jgi:hypothetical protein
MNSEQSDEQKQPEIFDIPEEQKPDTPTKEPDNVPVDDKKVKRRERLLANLAKGRATSLATRQKKALFKKIKKDEADDVINEAIKSKIMKKSELDLLREQVKELTTAKQNNLLKPDKQEPVKQEPEPPVEKFVQPEPVKQQPITLSTFSAINW